MNSERPVVFLDRDGVINYDSPAYIKSWSEFQFLPGSLQALADLTRQHFRVIVITNQSALHRGLTTPAALAHIHHMLCLTVAQAGGDITDIFFCPHTPAEQCACRKPRPGLLHQARDRYGLDLTTSTMIGDSVRDIDCAQRAGVGQTILVQTGNGARDLELLRASDHPPDMVVPDLAAAVNLLIKSQNRNEIRIL